MSTPNRLRGERRQPKPKLRRGADGKWYVHVTAAALTLDEATALGRTLQTIAAKTKTAYHTEGTHVV